MSANKAAVTAMLNVFIGCGRIVYANVHKFLAEMPSNNNGGILRRSL